ncbi:MAG: hypothetical protein IT304_13000 [Dehalococcoidia bacterium]|nr:hypothetical protein [Dehalococcoidia bacterium]
MKTAVSVPDDVFVQAERLVRRFGLSRSELYSRALREYVARHAEEDVTDALNAVIADIADDNGVLAREAGRRTLERSEW